METPTTYHWKNPALVPTDPQHPSNGTRDWIRQIREQAGQNGQWNHSPGICGLYNGLEMALAIIEGRHGVLRLSPERWLDETANARVFTLIANLMHLLDRVGSIACNSDPNGQHEVTISFASLLDAQATHRTLGRLRRAQVPLVAECQTLTVLGHEYVILDDLGQGFYLVATDVWPAVACSTRTEAGFDLIGSPARPHEDVPECVRTRAIQAIMQLAAASPTYPQPK